MRTSRMCAPRLAAVFVHSARQRPVHPFRPSKPRATGFAVCVMLDADPPTIRLPLTLCTDRDNPQAFAPAYDPKIQSTGQQSPLVSASYGRLGGLHVRCLHGVRPYGDRLSYTGCQMVRCLREPLRDLPHRCSMRMYASAALVLISCMCL